MNSLRLDLDDSAARKNETRQLFAVDATRIEARGKGMLLQTASCIVTKDHVLRALPATRPGSSVLARFVGTTLLVPSYQSHHEHIVRILLRQRSPRYETGMHHEHIVLFFHQIPRYPNRVRKFSHPLDILFRQAFFYPLILVTLSPPIVTQRRMQRPVIVIAPHRPPAIGRPYMPDYLTRVWTLVAKVPDQDDGAKVAMFVGFHCFGMKL